MRGIPRSPWQTRSGFSSKGPLEQMAAPSNRYGTSTN